RSSCHTAGAYGPGGSGAAIRMVLAGLALLDRGEFAPENVIRVRSGAACRRDQLGDLSALIPGVAKQLRENSLDIPTVAPSGARAPLPPASQFAVVEPAQIRRPSPFGVCHRGRQVCQLRS